MAEQMTFERAVKRLDEIVAALESGELPLDESLALYYEGAGLLALCEKILADAKLRVETLAEDE